MCRQPSCLGHFLLLLPLRGRIANVTIFRVKKQPRGLVVGHLAVGARYVAERSFVTEFTPLRRAVGAVVFPHCAQNVGITQINIEPVVVFRPRARSPAGGAAMDGSLEDIKQFVPDALAVFSHLLCLRFRVANDNLNVIIDPERPYPIGITFGVGLELLVEFAIAVELLVGLELLVEIGIGIVVGFGVERLVAAVAGEEIQGR